MHKWNQFGHNGYPTKIANSIMVIKNHIPSIALFTLFTTIHKINPYITNDTLVYDWIFDFVDNFTVHILNISSIFSNNSECFIIHIPINLE